jgi:acyl-CoA reductase-like NAD-dependent aldehyde dehydrogenase
MYINGEWVNAISGSFYDDCNPATGEVFARVPCGERADMKQAIDAADAS